VLQPGQIEQLQALVTDLRALTNALSAALAKRKGRGPHTLRERTRSAEIQAGIPLTPWISSPCGSELETREWRMLEALVHVYPRPCRAKRWESEQVHPRVAGYLVRILASCGVMDS